MAFEAEMATYERNKEQLLESEGQFVVIKGDDILGRYPTYAAAYDQGVKTFDHKPFLIKQILREDPVMFTPPTGVAATNLSSVWQYSTQFP